MIIKTTKEILTKTEEDFIMNPNKHNRKGNEEYKKYINEEWINKNLLIERIEQRKKELIHYSELDRANELDLLVKQCLCKSSEQKTSDDEESTPEFISSSVFGEHNTGEDVKISCDMENTNVNLKPLSRGMLESPMIHRPDVHEASSPVQNPEWSRWVNCLNCQTRYHEEKQTDVCPKCSMHGDMLPKDFVQKKCTCPECSKTEHPLDKYYREKEEAGKCKCVKPDLYIDELSRLNKCRRCGGAL